MKKSRMDILAAPDAYRCQSKCAFTAASARIVSVSLLALASLGGRVAMAEKSGGDSLVATPSAASSPPNVLPTEGDQPGKARSVGAGLGLSPNAPQVLAGANITAQEAQDLVPTTSAAGVDEWKFTFHGYMRGPMRFSWGPPTPTVTDSNNGPGFKPSDAPSGIQLHGKPRVPGASYIEWQYTNTVPDPWAQLNFSYGNSRAMMTVIVDSYGQTSAGYRDLQSQQGIDQAFVTLNYPEALGDRGGLVLNVGAFQNRYGTAGKYDAGMYETYLFGRTHVGGVTATANIDTGSSWGLTAEAGGGTKLEVIPFPNTQLFQVFKGAAAGNPPATNQGFGYARNLSDRDAEYLPYSGPVPQGSTFLAHGHLGLAYKKLLTFGAHLIYTWTPDDNWDSVNSNQLNVSDHTPRATHPSKGSMTIFGGEVRLSGGYLGEGYLGWSHIKATNINALSDAIEVLHSNGGWQFKENFFGVTFDPHTGSYQGPENESGTVDTIEAQYAFSFGSLARYPAAFWGDGPDLVATVFGMLCIVKSPSAVGVGGTPNPNWNMDTKKLKFGGDLIYTPLQWLGLGGRVDVVQPDLDAAYAKPGVAGGANNAGGNQLNFTVISPRLVFRTAFVTHEALTVMYQHYFLGSAAYSVYPYQWVPKADADLISVSGTMWW